MRFIATVKLGLESTVTRQLRDLGAKDVQAEDARVYFEGDYYDMSRALLWLRTAERVLLEIGSFQATSFDMLFEGTKALDWKKVLTPHNRIHVNGKSAKSALFSVSDCQSIVKKAIVEKLRQSYRCNTIPEDGEEVIVEIGMLRDTATLALDCCGAGLSRRGYRTYNVAAPLSETLGAAIVLLSHFRAEFPLLDPMCGSGTMPIEAAMIAQNRAPGLNRTFAAEAWEFLPADCFPRTREEARDSIRHIPIQIHGSDIDPHCIDLCKKHAKKAGIMATWSAEDIRDLAPRNERGVLVCNPPYGERMMTATQAAQLYSGMHEAFQRLPSFNLSVFSGYRDFEKAFGKRADKRRKLSNGGMSCQLYQYFASKQHEED